PAPARRPRSFLTLALRDALPIFGEEHLIAFDQVPDQAQPLAAVRLQPGVGEADGPVLDVPADQFYLLATLAQREVIGQALVVVQDRKSTRLTSSHVKSSYAGSCV